MKFAVCSECLDWVKLGRQDRTCRCGKTGGFYLPDGVNARVWGPGFAVGVDNRTFHKAVVHRNDKFRPSPDRYSEALATALREALCLSGRWWVIDLRDPRCHVEMFPSRRAATQPSRRARAAGPAATGRPAAPRRSP